MYCPNCGTNTSLDQKFCRSCGLGLEKIALSLAEQRPTKLDENLKERKNRLEQLGVIALSIFGVGVLSLFLYMVGSKLMLSQGKLVAALAVLGLIIILGSGLLSVLLFAKATEVEEAGNKRRLQTPDVDQTGKLLEEGHLEPVPSVTESTTELLFAEKKNDTKRS